MRQYIIRRLFQAIPLLVGISLVTFIVIHLAPGDPASLLIDPQASPEDFARIRAVYGLDKPIPVQYALWFGRMIRGDWGRSFIDRQLVWTKIWQRVPITLTISVITFFISLLVAIPVGVVSALRQYSVLDYVGTVFSFIGLCLPNFWFGLMLMLLFAIKLGWLPSHGIATYGTAFDLWDRARHLIMPVIVLGYGGAMAAYMRHTRSSLLEVIRQDFIRTARAKGLAERVVIFKHAIRNALLPLITLFGLALPGFLSGAVITEQLFAIPGMGQLAIQSVFNRDYNVLMAITMLSATMVVVGNLVADIMYAWVDPRIRY